jgi:hypothetical protein
MLQHTPGMPLDRKIMQKNALDLSFRSDQELGVSLEPSAERPLFRVLRTYAPSVFLALVACLLAVPLAGAQSDNRPVPTPSLFIEVQLDVPLKLSHLRPGSVLEGKVTREVYAGNRQLFPAGSRVHLTVGDLERRPREHHDHWPWVVHLFAPRHENYPSFQSASISLPDGTRIPMRVSFLSAIHQIEVSTRAKPAAQSHEVTQATSKVTSGKKKARRQMSGSGPTWILEAERPRGRDLPSTASGENCSNPVPPPLPEMLAAGTQAQVILLERLSASKNHAGDSFQVRLLEPVCLGSRVVLPEGALFEGHIVRSVPPRWLSRPGSLYLTFTKFALRTGEGAAIVASLADAEVDQRSRITMNSEGGLRGGSPGKARLLIDLGVTGGIAKVSDDSFQLIAEALISTATDASTAGSARLVAAALSALYLITRHGRDVILPKYTKMDITFDQPFRPPDEKRQSVVRNPD